MFDSVGRGDADRPGPTDAGRPLQVVNAASGEPVPDGLLKDIEHLLDPGAEDRQDIVQRHGGSDAIDLLLAIAGQVDRGLPQRLRGRAAGGCDHAARLVPLDDQRPTPEGGRELGRLWVPRTGSPHATCRYRGRGRRAGRVGARGWPPRNVAGCRVRAGAGPSDRCGRCVLKCWTYSRRTMSRWRGPVIRRWSRHSRRRVPMKRSAIAFARGARIGVRMMRMAAPVNTASNGR